MCILCCCCPSAGCWSYVAFIISGVEAFVFAILNLVFILACSCVIKPPEKRNLGTDILEKTWSWFFYNKQNCKNRDNGYRAPAWISNVPNSFENANIYPMVEQETNYVYQIVYLTMHVIWLASAIPMLYGHVRKIPKFYGLWLTMSAIIILLDTITGGFYIGFMDATNPGWSDGKAIFAMQFIYFRGFFVYVYNIFAFCCVFSAYRKAYRRKRREDKLRKKILLEVSQPAPIVVTPPTVYVEHSGFHQASRQYLSDVQTAQALRENERPTAPLKLRPFSYTNAAYRPNDPHDIEAMRMNAPSTSFNSRHLEYSKQIDGEVAVRRNVR